MAVSIAAVMRHVRNYFERGCVEGEFTVSGGVLSPAPAARYFAIEGSMYHDGVYREGELKESPAETFSGKVWTLCPPDDFIALCAEISAFDDNNPAGAMQSESFGEYSYTRMGGADGAPGWMRVFANQLHPYRRMFTEVGV